MDLGKGTRARETVWEKQETWVPIPAAGHQTAWETLGKAYGLYHLHTLLPRLAMIPDTLGLGVLSLMLFLSTEPYVLRSIYP